jgi:hypothetical protein
MKRKIAVVTVAILGIAIVRAWLLPPSSPTIHFVQFDTGSNMATFEIRNDTASAFHYMGADLNHPWLSFRLQTLRGVHQLMQPTGCILHSAHTIAPGNSVTFSIPAPKLESSAISVGVYFERDRADGSNPPSAFEMLEMWIRRLHARWTRELPLPEPTWSKFVPVTRVDLDALESVTGFRYP